MVDDGTEVGPTLGRDDVLVVSLLGLRMMAADVAANPSARDRGARCEARDMAAGDVVERLAHTEPGAADWRRRLAGRLASAPSYGHRRTILEQVVGEAQSHVPGRERQLAVLVELATAQPWPAGVTWAMDARIRALEAVVDGFDAIGRSDLAVVERERLALARLPRPRPAPPARAGAQIEVPAEVPGRAVALGALDAGVTVNASCLAIERWERTVREALRVELGVHVIVLGEHHDTGTARRVAHRLACRGDEVTVRLVLIATRLADPTTGAALRVQLERERAHALLAEETLRDASARLRARCTALGG